jgi:rhodanese-related sulfurtransferase
LGIEALLSVARARLRRLSPDEVYEALAEKSAILVDIRPEGQRSIEGIIQEALIVERNVLEWRFDPASEARLPVATGHDVWVIVFCSEDYTCLAAAALQDLGLWRGTDIIGGFHTWRAAGLPIALPGQVRISHILCLELSRRVLAQYGRSSRKAYPIAGLSLGIVCHGWP